MAIKKRIKTVASHISTPATGSPNATPAITVIDSKAQKSEPARSESMHGKYLRLSPMALGLADHEIEVFKADAVVVRGNVQSGVDALRPHRDQLLKRLPGIDWDQVLQAVDLAEALVVADERSTAPKVTAERIAAVRDQLQGLRVPALLIARGLALLGYLPLAEVERIEEGKGLIDMGRDGIALAHLFRTHSATIASLHPFDASRLAQMESLGEWIVRNVQPTTARKGVAKKSADAALGDRFWTLLTRTHRTMREGAFLLWGERYAEFVPALRVYCHSAKSEPPPAPPAPAPPAPAPEPVTP